MKSSAPGLIEELHLHPEKVLEVIAILATGLFAGAALFISLVQRPVLHRKVPAHVALSYWRPAFDLSRLLQLILAFIGFTAASFAAASGAGRVWYFAGGLLAAIIPYTLYAIVPTAKKLQDDKLDADSKEAKALLSRWHELHAFRTAMSLIAFVVMVAAK